jgi:hypothetical protein
MLCSLVDVYLAHFLTLKMEATYPSEMSVNCFQTTQCHSLEYSVLHRHYNENEPQIHHNCFILFYFFSVFKICLCWMYFYRSEVR